MFGVCLLEVWWKRQGCMNLDMERFKLWGSMDLVMQ